jgi:hypothetical protein
MSMRRDGDGRRVTCNFVLRDTGEFTDFQIGLLFLT